MRRLLLALLIVAGAVLALRSLLPAPAGRSTRPALATPGNSDYYIKDALVRKMKSDGQLAYRMTLGEVLHFPDDSARLSDIDVHYLAGSKTYWNVTAQRGRIPPGRRDIHLTGGVEARHPRPGAGTVKITTDNAWVRPERNRIDTRARVVAVEPGRRVTGDGMTVDLDKDKLKLLGNVHVTYTP